MAEKTESAKMVTSTLKEYRKWAKLTGRNLCDLVNIALLFALRKQSEVEREVVEKLEAKP